MEIAFDCPGRHVPRSGAVAAERFLLAFLVINILTEEIIAWADGEFQHRVLSRI